MTFQRKIKEIRQRLLLTQKELAEKLNCTDSHISLLEKGLRPATEKFFQKFVNTLELPDNEKENLRSLLIEERFRLEYRFTVKRECTKDIDLVKIPIGSILKDVLKYLKYGEDDEFKAAMIDSIATFYRVRLLRDLTENGYREYQKDLQRAFGNFRISKERTEDRAQETEKQDTDISEKV